jgi:polyisoprenyl-teichoic acid--peptidoglycan teichoic acid transferase
MEQRSLEPNAGKTVGQPDYAIAATIVYTIIILTVSLFGYIRLYDWARLRVVQTSPFASTQASSRNGWAIKPSTNPNAALPQAANGNSASGQSSQAAEPAVPVINILLLGTDERADDVSPPRTDTMIMLTLDPNTQTAGMLSMPRDLWVPIPGLDMANKINTAYMYGETRKYPGGGAQLAKNTVSAFIGHEVQYYVHLNFGGFVKLIDLIGGVDVIVPETIDDPNYPTANYGVETFHIDAGPQHLDGETALKYARTRHGDSDYGRARRQQTIIRAVMDKVLRADMIPTVLSNAGALLSTIRSSVDTDIPLATQLELATYLQKNKLQDIRQLVLDKQYGDEDPNGPEGAWILRPDRSKVRAAVASFFSPPPQGSSGVLASADPSWVRIQVLNGTDQPGVAAHTRDVLQSLGYHTVSIGDADRKDYGRTIIINYGVPQPLVEKVSSALGLQPDFSQLNGMSSAVPVDVRIVVGRDILASIPKH